ncbi:MAG: 50S ribosomal protein L9 [bacterium]
MEVILRQRVEGLGDRGQVKKVAAGYARNFLIPRGMAVKSTPAAMKELEQEKRIALSQAEQEHEMALKLADKLSKFTLMISRSAGETDRLFGSVTSNDIAEALAKHEIQVDRKKIEMEHPIKVLGEYTVPVDIHRGVRAGIKIKVVKEE